MKRLIIKILIVIVLALVVYFGLVFFSATLEAPDNGRGAEDRGFQGPVGDPYVRGPTSSPPAQN